MATAVESVQREIEKFRRHAHGLRVSADKAEHQAAEDREAARLLDEQADALQELLDDAERGRVPS